MKMDTKQIISIAIGFVAGMLVWQLVGKRLIPQSYEEYDEDDDE